MSKNDSNAATSPETDKDIGKLNDAPRDKLTKILAGEVSTFTEFRQEDYDKALSENKIIFLNFYASWCPICRAEAPAIHDGFNEIKTDQVAGFRVNFKDSDTDQNERLITQQFNVPIQHTKIIIKNGKEILRSSDTWTKEKFLTEIDKALGD